MLKDSKEHIKILSTLSLAASDTREDTLTSIIISTLFQKPIEKKSIVKEIGALYDFEPYESEIFQILDDLIGNGRVLAEGSILQLSDEEKTIFHKQEVELHDKDKHRFQNFKNFIIDDLGESIDIQKIKLIWGTFVEYLYNNFFEFGEEAFQRFHPHIEYKGGSNNDEDFFTIASKKLGDPELFRLFKLAVEKFPEYASSDDLDFLLDLAKKTVCFTSLGLSPELANADKNESKIDWVLYLDTNVLYSILNLHAHPESEACKALLTLINENGHNLKVTLRYSELTMKELKSRQNDFMLLDENLSDSSIRALLKSDHIDDFTKQFYRGLLEDRSSTIHPKKIIELAPQTLLQKYKVDISRNKKRIENIGESYLQSRVQDYQRFIDHKNSILQEFADQKGANAKQITKSDKQISHDITLREVILNQRSRLLKPGTEASFTSVKYFGLTLDRLLLDYDKSQIKDYNDIHSFPVFFRPSYLLSKLVRALPVKTKDYKKAFVKAITSKGFNKDPQKSTNILRIVNYLKAQGIDDEKVLYNLISKELFLENYNKNRHNPEFNEGDFIESELNREFKNKEKELEEVKSEISQKDEVIARQADLNTNLQNKSDQLDAKKKLLESEVRVYRKSIDKLRAEIRTIAKSASLPSSQKDLNFEAGNARRDAKKLKQKLRKVIEEKIEAHKNKELQVWKRKVWLHLIWVIPLTIVCTILVLFPPKIQNYVADVTSLRLIFGILVLSIDGIFIHNLVKPRYWDEANIANRLKNIEIPKHLKSELEELEEMSEN